jgi:hypothetical protein
VVGGSGVAVAPRHERPWSKREPGHCDGGHGRRSWRVLDHGSHDDAAATQRWLLELLPLLATLVSVVSRQQSDMFRLRLGTALSTLPWLPYCVLVGSWCNLCGLLVFLLMSVGALLRYHVWVATSRPHAH